VPDLSGKEPLEKWQLTDVHETSCITRYTAFEMCKEQDWNLSVEG